MDTVLIVMGILLAIVLVFGIYRLATAHLRERPSLKPSNEVNRSNTIQVVVVLILAAAVLVGMFFAYNYFTSL